MNDRKDHWIQLRLNADELTLIGDALGTFADAEPFDPRIYQAVDMAQGMYAMALALKKEQVTEDEVREHGEE